MEPGLKLSMDLQLRKKPTGEGTRANQNTASLKKVVLGVPICIPSGYYQSTHAYILIKVICKV